MKSRCKFFILCTFFFFCSCGDDNSNNSIVDASDEITSSEQQELLSSSSKTDSNKTGNSLSTKPEDSSSSSVRISSSAKPEGSSSSSVCSSSSAKSEYSSSSLVSSSSGVIENSSSSFVTTGVCKTELEDYCTYDSLYDERDGQIYKTVKIGEQWWMAENLRYEDAQRSACYADDPDNCLIYGKLYTRNGAINDCPNGWHLPTEKEWLKLQEYVKGNINENNVGQFLRTDSLWDVSGLGVGYDAFGFSALPGGAKDHDGWWGVNKHALFWLSDSYKNGSDDCYVYVQIRYKLKNDSDMQIGKTGNICDLYPSSKYSVRCIKD